jgi:hypothetical protein
MTDIFRIAICHQSGLWNLKWINTYIATIYQKIYPAMGHSSTEKKEWC